MAITESQRSFLSGGPTSRGSGATGFSRGFQQSTIASSAQGFGAGFLALAAGFGPIGLIGAGIGALIAAGLASSAAGKARRKSRVEQLRLNANLMSAEENFLFKSQDLAREATVELGQVELSTPEGIGYREAIASALNGPFSGQANLDLEIERAREETRLAKLDSIAGALINSPNVGLAAVSGALQGAGGALAIAGSAVALAASKQRGALQEKLGTAQLNAIETQGRFAQVLGQAQLTNARNQTASTRNITASTLALNRQQTATSFAQQRTAEAALFNIRAAGRRIPGRQQFELATFGLFGPINRMLGTRFSLAGFVNR